MSAPAGPMKCLIVEDEPIAGSLLRAMLEPLFQCDAALDGHAALRAVGEALRARSPYTLICLDIMMPNLDGEKALEQIRKMEAEAGLSAANESRIVMTTGVNEPKTVFSAFFQGRATAYLVKPIERAILMGELKSLGLLEPPAPEVAAVATETAPTEPLAKPGSMTP
jgi:two-component system, chemotaxis family, chemotaxis protein CheY